MAAQGKDSGARVVAVRHTAGMTQLLSRALVRSGLVRPIPAKTPEEEAARAEAQRRNARQTLLALAIAGALFAVMVIGALWLDDISAWVDTLGSQ